MKIQRKAQNSIELMLILFFALTIISLAMVVFGSLSLGIHEKKFQDELDDFAKMITNEFQYLQEAQNGYTREVVISPQLEEEYNLTIYSSHITLKPITYSGNDSFNERYYFFPLGLNITTKRVIHEDYTTPALVLIFTKNEKQDLSKNLQIE